MSKGFDFDQNGQYNPPLNKPEPRLQKSNEDSAGNGGPVVWIEGCLIASIIALAAALIVVAILKP